MARSIWRSLFLGLLGLHAVAGDRAHVAIDILPGQARNVIDVGAPDAIGVAIFGSDELDPRTIDLASLRLAGADTVKNAQGEPFTIDDVNLDGRPDLVVWFSARALRLAESDTTAVLTGSTRDGALIEGRDAILTLSAATRQDEPPSLSKQKFSTLPGTAEPTEATDAGEASPADERIRSRGPVPVVTSVGQYPGGIAIPDQGPASIYPATITVSGASGVISKLRITLSGISHTCYNDLDILLVGPTGQSLILSSDTGGCGSLATFTNITFDDFAATPLSPSTSAVPSGSYRPTNVGGGDAFPAPAPGPAGATSLSAFNGTNPNGTWSLFVFDDAGGDLGSIRDGWTLDFVTMTQFCNPGSITVPPSSIGSPYPSAITVSGLPENLAKVSVTLKGFTHNSPDALDAVLVDPSGARVMILSDAGGVTPVSDFELTLDDDFSLTVPIDGIAFEGTYHPTDYDPGDVLPAPAPAGPYSSRLASLVGHDPNGTWRLYVADDTAGSGTISQGWCLNVTVIPPSDTCRMVPIAAPGAGTIGAASPYPSVMTVSGASGVVQRIRVDLLGVTHTYPDDLDVVLQAPDGRTMPVVSDSGGPNDVINHDIAFDSALLTYAPDNDPWGHGPYQMSDYVDADGDLFPAPAPQPPFGGGAMYGAKPNGNWKLWVQDDASLDSGTIAGWCMSMSLSEPIASGCVGGPSSMFVPSGAPQSTVGTASPYPWTIPVNADGTIVGRVVVRLENFSHTFPDDVDILLVGPQGQAAIIMSDAGGDLDVVEQHITLDDDAPFLPPNEGPLTGGTYRAGDYPPADGNFAAPAPAGPYASYLGVFKGTNPNGTWKLFVNDDAGGDWGSINRWCLDIYPLYPSGEVTNLRWRSGAKTTLEWDAAPNTSDYTILRGTRDQLLGLLNSSVDSCVLAGEHRQFADYITGEPPAGSMFWYLVVGESGGVRGPSGNLRIGGTETARTLDSSPGACAP